MAAPSPSRGTITAPLFRLRKSSRLTLNEKRAILASWASDSCAIEAAPTLRQAPGSGQRVRFDDVMDALRALDQQAGDHDRGPPRYRRVLENRIPGVFGRKSRNHRTSGHGHSIN